MCYGMGCKFELSSGECGRQSFVVDEDGNKHPTVCPSNMISCDSCGELFVETEIVDVLYVKDNLPAIVCENCAADEDIFKVL